eukprot:gnl/MRDRNA2_/MRDRNA2_68598_c0_seq1.p1 gnl/MRDRNA2_/MRDRNA2_68598_c0~~gnl/MRDRNA2_/MRDRNA2_68598_c0_seq1.p1  ORF type:complete len:279 (+),score=25.51 gnl/MRDRNA2_/MRDRNA2_68598_c0_seq1:122-958(+)
MRSVSVIILQAFAVQTSTKELEANYTGSSWVSTDKLVDKTFSKFLDRAQQILPLHHTDLDNVVLKKSVHRTLPSHANLRDFSLFSQSPATQGRYSKLQPYSSHPGKDMLPGRFSFFSTPHLRKKWIDRLQTSRAKKYYGDAPPDLVYTRDDSVFDLLTNQSVNMDVEALRDDIEAFLDSKKAMDITNIDLRGISSLADFFVIASATNRIQLASMAMLLTKDLKLKGFESNIEGRGRGQTDWILIDVGDIIVHLFNTETREYYDLEGMWDYTRRTQDDY